MEPLLYETFGNTIQSLPTEATRMHLGPEITPRRIRNYLSRIARPLDVPVTIRGVPGGLIFWRSAAGNRHQAREVAGRLQTPSGEGERAHKGASAGDRPRIKLAGRSSGRRLFLCASPFPRRPKPGLSTADLH